MRVVYIYKEDDESRELSRLCEGYHYIGREAPIESNDKRISRRHALIVIHRNGVILKSANENPTYFKSPLGVTVQMLHKDETLSLNNGDRLALVEDGVWFKIKIILENNLNEGIMVDRYSEIHSKRSNDEDNMQVSKKIKLEPEDVCHYCGNSSCDHDKGSTEELNETLPYSNSDRLSLNGGNNADSTTKQATLNQSSVTNTSVSSHTPPTADNIPDSSDDTALEIKEEPPETSNYDKSVPSFSKETGVPCKDLNREPSVGRVTYSGQSDEIVCSGPSNQVTEVRTEPIIKDELTSNSDDSVSTLEMEQEPPELPDNGIIAPCQPIIKDELTSNSDDSVSTLEMEQEPPELPDNGIIAPWQPIIKNELTSNSDDSVSTLEMEQEPPELPDNRIIAPWQPIIRNELTSNSDGSVSTLEMEQEPPELPDNGIIAPSINDSTGASAPSMIKREEIKEEHPGSSNSTIRVKTEAALKQESKSDTDNPETNLNIPQLIPANNPVAVLNARRDRCWYGRQCYRNNPLHKLRLSHPGDPDYDNDTELNQQPCPYGLQCYRRNILHRRLYKHYGPPAERPQQLTFALL
ncbi:uncharacterized protein [Diabrotica undecimpunctata]|uniref:uncharacterized protein n=1 Tax=Diabrotica undecimpunctata TaxID=50387 RepID=UPI003B63EC2C